MVAVHDVAVADGVGGDGVVFLLQFVVLFLM